MKRIFFYITFVLLTPLLSGAQEGLLLPLRHLEQPFGQTAGLWHGEERNLRYRPEGEDLVIVNGAHRFNRALYGTHTAFRVEAGDLPEFALYMPGMGGNWRFGLTKGDSSKWLTKAAYIKAIYRAGSMLYEIRDPMLGRQGVLKVTILALADEEGMIIKVSSSALAPGLQLSITYGGASGKKFSRDGDIGADPESSFYCKSEYCVGNRYVIDSNHFQLTYGGTAAAGKTGPRQLEGVFPVGVMLKLDDAGGGDAPVVTGHLLLPGSGDHFFMVRNPGKTDSTPDYSSLPAFFKAAEETRALISGRVQVRTPDAYINTLGGVLAIAGDAIWEDPSYLHGAVAWRMRLNGWRGPYVADPLGWHDRARKHFSGYAASQMTGPDDARVVADTALHLARQLEKTGTALFSDGYISRNPGGDLRANHYDMNLVYIDELLNHFYWTGDTAYVREMWPVLQRHLAWEKRNFDSDGDGLYDAYACIWASDALEYSGGGVTHSSAYNYRANKVAAALATLIGKDPEPYRAEADKILKAIDQKLWMPTKGWYAEYLDRADGHEVRTGLTDGEKQLRGLHPAAGLWTIYHAIDSHVPDAFQAWQSLRYIDTEIPHIPVRALGLEDTSLYTLSTTNWQPYSWSLNNVVMAESLHTALAYWQGGRGEDAFPLWKGALVESMYLGASPGNFQQISYYDAMRGELYRDFADPIGMAARSLVEGLFGVWPDALSDTLTIRPGWPLQWDSASLQIPDLSIDYIKKGFTDQYTIVPAFCKKMNLLLQLRARGAGVRRLTVNGTPVRWTNIETAIGRPMVQVIVPPAAVYRISVSWDTTALPKPVTGAAYSPGELLAFDGGGAKVLRIYDPEHALGRAVLTDDDLQATVQPGGGNKTVFVRLEKGDFRWWDPVCFRVRDKPAASPGDVAAAGAGASSGDGKYEKIILSAYFNDEVINIFKHQYLSPRPASPTLQLPTQGIGNWCYPLVTANIDDAGLKKLAGKKNEIRLPAGVPLATPGSGDKNIVFTSRWDNFPDTVTITLQGKASHAWFLMAGSTNPMQSRFTNGVIDVFYKDGTMDELPLINPSSWWPIEQDYYEDGYAFTIDAPRPYRVYLKTGQVSNRRVDWKPIKGFTDTGIDGGAATVLDMPLHAGRELDRLVLRTVANEVVIGLMSLTLLRN